LSQKKRPFYAYGNWVLGPCVNIVQSFHKRQEKRNMFAVISLSSETTKRTPNNLLDIGHSFNRTKG
jgi:hypothetical protein